VFSATVVVLLSMYQPVRARPGLRGGGGEGEGGAPDPVTTAPPERMAGPGVPEALLPGQ